MLKCYLFPKYTRVGYLITVLLTKPNPSSISLSWAVHIVSKEGQFDAVEECFCINLNAQDLKGMTPHTVQYFINLLPTLYSCFLGTESSALRKKE